MLVYKYVYAYQNSTTTATPLLLAVAHYGEDKAEKSKTHALKKDIYHISEISSPRQLESLFRLPPLSHADFPLCSIFQTRELNARDFLGHNSAPRRSFDML